jgi:hypothetical protein
MIGGQEGNGLDIAAVVCLGYPLKVRFVSSPLHSSTQNFSFQYADSRVFCSEKCRTLLSDASFNDRTARRGAAIDHKHSLR